MKVKIEESWRQRLQEEFDKPYFERLVSFVKSEYGRANVLPPGHLIFHVFNSCPLKSKSGYLRTRSLPQPRTILRDMLFRTGRSSHTGITRQYIQGDTSRLRQTDSYFRQSGPLGGSGSILHELCPYGTRPRNRFAPQRGLGNFHRCGNQEIK